MAFFAPKAGQADGVGFPVCDEEGAMLEPLISQFGPDPTVTLVANSAAAMRQPRPLVQARQIGSRASEL